MVNSRNRFHHIQRGIILSLINKSPLRFTELQPPRVPNNTFSYHLKKLLDAGYVEQVEEGYLPTRKSLKLVVFQNAEKSHKSVPLPVVVLYVENSRGEVLLLNRNYKPFQGWYGLPSGLIHVGDDLQDAARRELFEKTSIELDQSQMLEEKGVLDFRYVEDGTDDIFVHAIAFVFKYSYQGDPEILADKKLQYGQLSWSTLARNHILPEVLAIKDMVHRALVPFHSVTFHEPMHYPVFIETEVEGDSFSVTNEKSLG